jgi:hypothetical protein
MALQRFPSDEVSFTDDRTYDVAVGTRGSISAAPG